jgi:hypothetical protein
MRTGVKTEVSVSRFTACLMAQRAIGSSGSMYVREEKVAISFHLHGEPNVLVDSVQVVERVPQPVRPMGPGVESVICIMEPAERLAGCAVKVHCEEVGFACCLLHAGFLFSLLFNSQDGGSTFL